jgi:hypothetical protein
MQNIDNKALKSLLIHIEEETTPEGTTVHQNRFFRWMADCLNHRMGVIGNFHFLKDAQHHLDDKLTIINSHMQEVENMVTHLELVLAIANHDVNDQVDQHIKNMGTQLQHTTSTISETCQFYESRIKSYCTQEEEDLKDTIAKVLMTLNQETMTIILVQDLPTSQGY